MVYHDWIHKNMKYKIIYHTSVQSCAKMIEELRVPNIMAVRGFFYIYIYIGTIRLCRMRINLCVKNKYLHVVFVLKFFFFFFNKRL